MSKTKKRLNFGDISLILLTFLIVGGALYKHLVPYLASLQKSSALNEYKNEISACVSAKEATLGNEVVGLEYSCAIDVAASFYESDPEKAIELCINHNPFFNVQIGSGDPNEQIVRSSCKLSIEERLGA